MADSRCERCGEESYTTYSLCSGCLAFLAPPPPGQPLAVYTTPNALVALYEDGFTATFDGSAWSQPNKLWPSHDSVLEQAARRHPEAVTAAGWLALGRAAPAEPLF